MSVVLPKIVDYQQPLYSLPPDTNTIECVSSPVNGSVFGENAQIDVDLQNYGFMIPDSLFIRYKMTTTQALASTTYMCGTPVYTPFQKLTTLIQNQTFETLNNYNVIANMYANLTMNVADKLGSQGCFGYYSNVATPVTNEQTDGGQFITTTATTSVKTVAAPLLCALSQSEKALPLFLLNNIRLSFNTDTIANMFSVLNDSETAVALPTGFQISNFEVVYRAVNFGSEVERNIMSMDKIRIKSQTWGLSSSMLPSGTGAGTVNLNYTQQFNSVKSLYLACGGGTRTISANGNMDAYNVAGDAGSYQFIVNGTAYPQRALSCNLNMNGLQQELRQAIGSSIFDSRNSMSINMYEWYVQASEGTGTSTIAPAKFYVGLNLEKIKGERNNNLFTGISTGSSNITAIINVGTALTQNYNCQLILNADYILEIEPASRNIMIIK